jgi:hypothetical protein
LRLGGCVLLARLAFIMTEVANLPFDADEVYKQGANFIVLSGIKRRGFANPGGPREQQDSPSLTRTTFITSHMTSSTVQAGMVYLAPFAHF